MQIRKGCYIYTDSEMYNNCFQVTVGQVSYLVGKILTCFSFHHMKMCDVEWLNDDNGVNVTSEEIRHINNHFEIINESYALALII